MSCFNGQMKEYNRIAIDRFDGKNLQCTAFFLSHCHIDHMVGLNSWSFENSLQKRNGIFLYCSEITCLLLLADKDYRHLQKFIRVLKVGVSQPVSVPSNNIYEEDYYVNVTLISAGHCLGSVMFLFEGHEGKCLYTGDFRWEINHVAGIAAFKDESGLKHMKSMYVDTTFCTPEAFHIPKRSECIDAAAALIAEWLQRSPSNFVFMSCPARYGYEHLLMELSAKLNIKIHVPEWKIKIYDQIPDLQNVFTSDPAQTRIHACSAKVSYTSLPCHGNSRSRHSVLNLRPSAMWFTSEKSAAKREDLVVPPASPKGLYRICYSTHSSYSEIRDLVSYLQPENAFPNVQPESDNSINITQERLQSFQKHVNSARVQMCDGKTSFQPLGTLRKIISVHTSMQKQQNKQDAASSDELVFSSQEADSKKGLQRPIITSSRYMPSKPRAGMMEETINFSLAANEGSPSDAALSNSSSNEHSSHRGSVVSVEKMFFSDSGEQCRKASLHVLKSDGDSLHSSDSATSENTSNGEYEVIPFGEYDKDAIIAHSATHVGDMDSKCGESQSKQDVSLTQQQKSQKPSVISTDYPCEIDLRPQHTKDSNVHEQTVAKTTTCSDMSMSVIPLSHTEIYNVTKKNNSVNDCTTLNSFKDDDDNEDSDLVFNSQVSATTALIPNPVRLMVSENMSAISDQRKEDHETTEKNIIDNDTSPSSQIPEAVTVLSSSEDSLNILEPESQTLWSVSYSLNNFAHVYYSDTKIPLGNSVSSIHIGKDDSSLKQKEGITLQTLEVQRPSCRNKKSSQFKEDKNGKQLKTYATLKRKSITNGVDNERCLKSIKKFTNDEKCAEVENKCNLNGQQAKGLFTRLKKSSLNERNITDSERNVNGVENTHTETTYHRQDHIWVSDNCHNDSHGDMSVHSVQILKKYDLIDLTIETPTEVVDLTLEDSP